MVVNHYYNIFRKSNNEFVGTVAVRSDSESENPSPPSDVACMIAEGVLASRQEEYTGLVGLRAVMSTKEMHLQYGLN